MVAELANKLDGAEELVHRATVLMGIIDAVTWNDKNEIVRSCSQIIKYTKMVQDKFEHIVTNDD